MPTCGQVRLAAWWLIGLTLLLLTAHSVEAALGCKLDAAELRRSFELQGSEFKSGFVLGLQDGVSCLREVKTPWGAANQSVNAYASFYEQFYAFNQIAADPPASVHSQAMAMGLEFSVYGSSKGGGESRWEADVNLGKSLRALVAGEDQISAVSVLDWYIQMNDIFNRLRDAHVNFHNGHTKVDLALNRFIFFLQDDKSKQAVDIQVKSDRYKSEGPAPDYHVDSDSDHVAKPRFMSSSGEIVKVAGMEPMKWFEQTILDNSAFPLPFKSMGARANSMLQLGKLGFAWLAGRLGDVSKLTPTVRVSYADGSEGTWSWMWLLPTKHFTEQCALMDGLCYTNSMTGQLTTPSDLFRSAQDAAEDLSRVKHLDRQSASEPVVRSNDAAPELPHRELFAKLRQEPELRDFLGIPEARLPGSESTALNLPRNSSNASTQQLGAAFSAGSPRRWLLNPSESKSGGTYGFYELRKDGSGDPFFVVKMPTFGVRGEDDFDLIQEFVSFWKDLVKDAVDQGVNRLLLDVAGNSGGYVNLAYMVARAFFPEEPFERVCNEYDRPIGSLYEAFTRINRSACQIFLDDQVSVDRRAKELRSNPVLLSQLRDVTSQLIKAGMDLDLLDDEQLETLSDNLDEFDKGDILDGQELRRVLLKFQDLVKTFGNPFAQELGGYNASGKHFDPYEVPVVRPRGGNDKAKFTAKFRFQDCASAYSQKLIDALEQVRNPFDEILILSDGLCGSSCDTATRTSYMLSKQITAEGRKAPRISYLSFGGLGGSTQEARATLSGTSFPGGNVQSNAMYTVYNPVLVTALFGYLAVSWAGLDTVRHQITAFKELVPEYPFYSNALPKYAQSELYQNALGPEALPSEYYHYPTDLYLPEWYSFVTGAPADWDQQELAEMYRDAAKFFRVAPASSGWGSWLEGVFKGREASLGSSSSSGSGNGGGAPPAWLMFVAGVATMLATAGLVTLALRSRRNSSKLNDESDCESASGDSSN